MFIRNASEPFGCVHGVFPPVKGCFLSDAVDDVVEGAFALLSQVVLGGV